MSMSLEQRTKPIRSTYTSKLSDPHDIYRGRTNHWSIMRVDGDTFALTTKEKERQARTGQKEGPRPLESCNVAHPYVWSRDKAQQLRGEPNFYDKVLSDLKGMLPGDLSKDLHRNYNKSLIRWPLTPARAHAKSHFHYWFDSDKTGFLSKRPHMDRNKVPI